MEESNRAEPTPETPVWRPRARADFLPLSPGNQHSPPFPTRPPPMTTFQREPLPTRESPVDQTGTVQALVTPLLQPRAGTN